MKRFTLLVFAFVLVTIGSAQDSISIGSTGHVYSKILKEDRIYSVSLPVNYHNKKYTPVNYPVLYVLDGETSFEYINAIVKFLSKGVYAHIPEMIVVGVHNRNRTRDLTPTRSSKRSPDDSTKILFEDSGGNAAFTSFISEELIPHIDSNYRSNSFRIIAGHSFGGLAVTNILLHQPEIFKAFIIHDPSYWWHDAYMLEEARKILPLTNFEKKRIFLSQAANEDKGGFDDHFENIKLFNKVVDSVSNKTLVYKYTFYKQEDHGTIPLPATFDGLKYIFNDFWIDFKKISEDENLLSDHYKAFSENINDAFQPGEPMLDFIVNYFKKQHKISEAEIVLKQYQKLYPKTAPSKL